jgi:hypothetical protein
MIQAVVYSDDCCTSLSFVSRHLSRICIGKVWGDIPRDIARNIAPYLLILVNRNDPISAAQGQQGKLRP